MKKALTNGSSFQLLLRNCWARLENRLANVWHFRFSVRPENDLKVASRSASISMLILWNSPTAFSPPPARWVKTDMCDNSRSRFSALSFRPFMDFCIWAQEVMAKAVAAVYAQAYGVSTTIDPQKLTDTVFTRIGHGSTESGRWRAFVKHLVGLLDAEYGPCP